MLPSKYVQQKFAEIAFCAIDSSEQVRGHGTRLMNEIKNFFIILLYLYKIQEVIIIN